MHVYKEFMRLCDLNFLLQSLYILTEFVQNIEQIFQVSQNINSDTDNSMP